MVVVLLKTDLQCYQKKIIEWHFLKIHGDTAGMAVPGGRRGHTPPTQILADQLTLSQPGRADSAHHITTRLDFQTCRHPCIAYY